MRIVIAPDSYKGSLSALEVGLTIQEAFQLEIPWAQIQVVPMADGGEGTLETLVFASQGQKIKTTATGPLGEPVETYYGVLGDRKTAVIEIAQIAGLTMVPEPERNPMQTSSYGMGELIAQALDQGLRNFIICLGGSATNDCGLGMLQALGAVFMDQAGQPVMPVGASLNTIKSVSFTSVHPAIQECHFKIACDVKNPLCGPGGATQVYGPQKGATPEQVELLDNGMASFANLVERELAKEWQQVPGAGAAGGLGFAFLALGGTLEPGAQIISDATGLRDLVKNADWVLTGEGQSDEQTLFGKLPIYVASMAKELGKPTILLSGALGKGHENLLEHFFSCHATTIHPVSLAEAMTLAKPNLHFCARNVARLLKTVYQ